MLSANHNIPGNLSIIMFQAISPPRIRITDTSRETSPKSNFLTVGVTKISTAKQYLNVIKQSSSNQEVAELVTNKQWPSDQLTALTYYV